MYNIMKLNDEYAIGEVSGGIRIFAYFEDVDGIRWNHRAGNVLIDDDAIGALKRYLEFDDGETSVEFVEMA